MAKLGDFLTAINLSKKNLMEDDPLSENEYPPFVINRSLSYFQDTVLYANEMNLRPHIETRLQNDYYLNSVRKKKRFSRWLKPDQDDDIDVIKEYYSCSEMKAREVLSILTDNQLSLIHQRLQRGGIKNGKRSKM